MTPVLSHLLNSCPNLNTLDVKLAMQVDFSVVFDVVAKLRDSVLPRLPQTETVVVIQLSFYTWYRNIYDVRCVSVSRVTVCYSCKLLGSDAQARGGNPQGLRH